MFGPYLLAFIAVLFLSFEAIIFRIGMKEDACPWSILLYYHLVAVALLIPFVDFAVITQISQEEFYLLSLSGLMWLIGDLLQTKACKYLDASACSVYGSLTLITVAIAGVFVFSESLENTTILGMALIIFATYWQYRSKKQGFSVGVVLELVSVIFKTGGLIIDKHLTTVVAEEVVIFYGFLLPISIFIVLGYRKIPNMVSSIKKSRYLFLIAPVLGLISYSCLIKAMARGDLAVTYTIQHTSIIFIFLLEAIFLEVRENFRNRAFAATTCAVGAVMVCVF